MNEDRKREAGKRLGITAAGALALAIFVSLLGDLSLPLTLLIWGVWCGGGLFGISVARELKPIYNNCACDDCQANLDDMTIAFVAWPLYVPGMAAATFFAWLVRSAL